MNIKKFFSGITNEIDMKTLKSIIQSIEDINHFKVNHKEGTFQIEVVGFQKTEVVLTRLDGERLKILAIFKVSKDCVLSALLTTILWNQQTRTAHNVFAYTWFDCDCFLESHLSCQGGVTEEHVKIWIKNFTKSFGPFEELLTTTLKKYGHDDQLQPDFLAATKAGEKLKGSEKIETAVNMVGSALYIIAHLLAKD